MRLTLMLALLLVCSVGATSQELHYDTNVYKDLHPRFRKLIKLHQKRVYEALSKKIQKFKTKNPSSAVPDYMLAILSYELALDATLASERNRECVRLLRAYNHGLRKGQNSGPLVLDTVLAGSIRALFTDQAHTLFQAGKLPRARYYTKSLARYFKDTLDIYSVLYPPLVKHQIAVKTEPKRLNKNKKADYATKFVDPTVPAEREALANFATKSVGTRYKWGGEAPGGFDCSGFVLYVYRSFGYDFLHSAREIAKIGQHVDKNQMRKGDLLFFGKKGPGNSSKISHIAILYSDDPGNLKVIHATNKGVLIDGLNEKDYWTRKLLFAKNIIDPENNGRALYPSN